MADITLTYTLSDDGTYYIVTGTSSEGDTVNIPNTHDGKQVKEIKAKAFFGKSNIINVIIPDSVVSIGSKAFHDCSRLTSVTIGDSVKSIGDYAFQDCSSLTSITIPASVTSIGLGAFYRCLSLASVVFAEGGQYTNIGEYAFHRCYSLTSVVIPNSVTSIGQYAFDYCISLGSITLPFVGATAEGTSNTHFGYIFGASSYFDEGYIPTSLKTVIITGGTSIGEYAFYNCIGLTSITIPSSVTEIGNNAFANCTRLLFIVIPETVTEFGTTIFNNCDASAKFYFQYNDTTKSLNIGGGTKLYYYSPNMPYNEMDFLGFTFNGKHSYLDLGVIRIINDRIQTQLSPDISDLTAESTGSDGIYFFGSYHKSRKFTVDFAFDNLTETQLRNWKKFCSYKDLSDLIFDEEPYKVYTAKIASAPILKTIAFEENGQRIYKGEGTLEFICYWPYAHTPNPNTKVSTRFISDGQFFGDGKNLALYFDGMYPTKNQWSLTSGLTDNFVVGSNNGDIPAPFVFKAPQVIAATGSANLTFAVGDLAITVPAKTATTSGTTTTYTHHNKIEWDSKTGIVSAEIDEKRKPILYTGNSLGAIPVGGVGQSWGIRSGTSPSYTYNQTGYSLEYDYWYY